MATSFPELLQTKSALLADLDRGAGSPERLLVRSDLTGTMQLYELGPGDGQRQVTALDEPVGGAFYVPGSRKAVLEVDTGGNERHQLYLVDLDGANRPGAASFEDLEALTDDAAHGHHIAGIRPDGRAVAYVSNRANGVDFDLWTCDLSTGEHRLAYAGRSWLQPASGFSPDGRFISVHRPGPRPLDVDLLLVDSEHSKPRRARPPGRGRTGRSPGLDRSHRLLRLVERRQRPFPPSSASTSRQASRRRSRSSVTPGTPNR